MAFLPESAYTIVLHGQDKKKTAYLFGANCCTIISHGNDFPIKLKITYRDAFHYVDLLSSECRSVPVYLFFVDGGFHLVFPDNDSNSEFYGSIGKPISIKIQSSLVHRAKLFETCVHCPPDSDNSVVMVTGVIGKDLFI